MSKTDSANAAIGADERRPVHVTHVPPRIERNRPTRPDEIAPIVFVGGTGRSGTHVLARLIGRNSLYCTIPVECRFHVDPDGFPALLAGEVSKSRFLRRMRGFWWRGFQTNRMRGMYRFIPKERYDAALAAFDERFDGDPEGACRQLFFDLLMARARDRGLHGIVEQSCDVIAQAPTLVRLFPEAKFIHVVRDGRDASASRVSQTRGLVYPRTRRQGLEWWEKRIRAIDAGARAIPEGRFLEVSLDELVEGPRRGALVPIANFVGVRPGPRLRRFYFGQMRADRGNFERWRRDISARKAADIDARYRAALERLEADGITCAPLLRRTYERRRQRELDKG
jgi:Sulfotransferase domain.